MFIVELIGGLLILVVGAQIFTNAVEWVGNKLNMSQGGIGSILAAVGTALPESMVPLLAILTGKDMDIGVGAILGAPLMLATLGFGIIGLTALFSGRKDLKFDGSHMGRDLTVFVGVYFLAVLAGLIDNELLKTVIAVTLIIAYVVYAVLTLRGNDENEGHELDPLYFARKQTNPSLALALLQLFLALAIIIFGAHMFVGGVELVAEIFGIPTLITAMIVTPIATELPEKLNSVIWVRQGKDSLAMGNMTGAMVFQGSVIVTIGIFGTPWALDGLSIISSIIAILSASFILARVKLRGGKVSPYDLVGTSLLYIVYLGVAVYVLRGGTLG